jgi:hypothetical protein
LFYATAFAPIAAGRFRKGRSGNPAGRPRGSRNAATLAAETLLDGEAEALTHKAIANAAKAFEIAEIAEHAQLDRMTDAELLRVITMGGNGADIAKQVAGLLTIAPR